MPSGRAIAIAAFGAWRLLDTVSAERRHVWDQIHTIDRAVPSATTGRVISELLRPRTGPRGKVNRLLTKRS
jgi:hypothetical protein